MSKNDNYLEEIRNSVERTGGIQRCPDAIVQMYCRKVHRTTIWGIHRVHPDMVWPVRKPGSSTQGPMGKEGLESEKKMAVITACFDGTTGEMAPQNGFGTGLLDIGWKLEGYTYHDNDDGGGDGCGGEADRAPGFLRR
ncbi:hypothetical protein PYCCODRAFT_1422595 [Trametes coccinea BRFM310]|uniref:Uncharacterized protein n=1 Tax=Trametes coccinea (strain BRFM310) TaxID=1353009 RepID=A0A1Y2IYP8_TRAC3|nr:hypothetical protein PYCCODRAFT_1422595 [Trametes coccinea BRFM310]